MSPRAGVLLVGPVSGDGVVGGIENGIDMILRSPVARRHGVVLFNSYRARDRSRSFPRRVASEVVTFGRYLRRLAEVRPRVVHVKTAEGVNFYQAIGYAALARLAVARVLLQIHGGSFDLWYEQLSPARQAVVRLGLRLPHALVVLSEYWRDYINTLRPGRPVHVLPNAVDLGCAVESRDRPGPTVRVLTIGAIGARKGHFEIVEAARLLCEERVLFQFVGPDEFGGETEDLARRIARYRLDGIVQLLGAVTGAAKWELLAEADIFLLPSHNENMPNAVLEAMAASLPIICSRVGAIPEMIEESGVRFVAPGEPEAIAAAVRELLHDRARRVAMGRANRARIDARYALDRILPILDRLYTAA